eukprot:CAMPEP_0167749958 /NCGR_PEP_ID=MMETSP0110_2-20121227/5714_1 /TAXON_ID=629695 /ORGANISM="Gymnochlora sp., Strain CCMP2014" /LENGTH=382 /DNA_ID=CAMNT_0007635205 /DNA_START=253 /DNA_END=1404 /DNA_ORIENTATION=-
MYFLNRAAFVTVNDRELPDMYWKILVSFVSFMIVTEYIILIVAVATDNHFFLGLRDLWWVVLALFYLLISIISVSKIRKQLKSFHSRAELLQNDAKMYPINRAKKVSDPKTDFNTGLIIKAAEKLQIRLYVISFFAFALILVLIYAASQHFREDKGIRETYNETRGEYSLAEDFNRWAATAWVPFLVWYSYVPIKGLTFNTSTVVPRSSHKTPNTMLRRGELGRSDASPRRVRSKVSPSTPRIVLVASPKGSDTPRISMVVGKGSRDMRNFNPIGQESKEDIKDNSKFPLIPELSISRSRKSKSTDLKRQFSETKKALQSARSAVALRRDKGDGDSITGRSAGTGSAGTGSEGERSVGERSARASRRNKSSVNAASSFAGIV